MTHSDAFRKRQSVRGRSRGALPGAIAADGGSSSEQESRRHTAPPFPFPVRVAEIIAGIVCASLGIKMFIRTKNHLKSDTESTAKAPKQQLTPTGLFFIGAAFCMVELTSALPYFGFLAVLAGYNLAMPYVLGLIFLYSTIYAAPLILLYFVYNRLRGTALIARLEMILSKVSIYILPVAIIIVSGVMLIDGSYSLLR